MSAPVASTSDIAEKDKEQTDKRIDLLNRLLQAGMANSTLLPRVEKDALFFILPDDDPTFLEREITAATEAARKGHNVYLHHVRVADLPELPSEPTGPPVGLRRTHFNWDGSIAEQEVCGPDGAWHKVDPPEPVDE